MDTRGHRIVSAVRLKRLIPDLGLTAVHGPADPGPTLPADLEARHARDRAAAFDRGHAVGHAEALAALESARRAHAAELVEHIATARAAWLREESDRMAGLFEARIADAAMWLGDGLAELLQMSILRSLQREAIEAAVEDVLRAVPDHATAIVVEGPPDLATSLAEALAARGVSATIAVTSAVEARVVVDRTIIETAVTKAIARVVEVGA
jgi:hypothetical protein